MIDTTVNACAWRGRKARAGLAERTVKPNQPEAEAKGWPEGEPIIKGKPAAGQTASQGQGEPDDRRDQHDAWQPLPGNECTGCREQLHIAKAQPVAPAEAPIPPSDKGESDKPGDGAQRMRPHAINVHKISGEQTERDERQRQDVGENALAPVDDGEG